MGDTERIIQKYDKLLGLITGEVVATHKGDVIKCIINYKNGDSSDNSDSDRDHIKTNALAALRILNIKIFEIKSYILKGFGLLWSLILDVAICALNKNIILSLNTYCNYVDEDYLLPLIHAQYATNYLFEISQSLSLPYTDNIDISYYKAISNALFIFKTSNSFTAGMAMIASIDDLLIKSLYGQVAGAYYGISDIDLNAIESIENPEDILKAYYQ